MTARILAVLLAAGLLGGGTTAGRATPAPPSEIAPIPPRPPVASRFADPVLAPDGSCTGPVPALVATIEPGIGECDLVRLEGKPPTDVLVGEGRAGREVQVLYTEPGARELSFFVDNRLDRIVK